MKGRIGKRGYRLKKLQRKLVHKCGALIDPYSVVCGACGGDVCPRRTAAFRARLKPIEAGA